MCRLQNATGNTITRVEHTPKNRWLLTMQAKVLSQKQRKQKEKEENDV